MPKTKSKRQANSSFAAELILGQRQTLIDIVRSKPQVTLTEILTGGGDAVGQLTVGELVEGIAKLSGRGGRGRKPNGSATTTRRGKTAANGKGKALNLRTDDARDAYDNAVLAAIKKAGGKDVRAEAIRAEVGGTSTQVRTSLERWMEEGGVKKRGERRATVYRLA